MNKTGALIVNKYRESMIFLILILISGQVDCAKVSAYTGGSVLIMCKYDQTEKINHTKYFCKLSGQDCTEKIYSNTTDHEGRVFFVDGNWPGMFPVLIKNIHQQDEGTYRCGVEERKPQAQFTVDLSVKEDPCCEKTLTQETHSGETVNFTCVYPEEFKYHRKYMYKVTNRSFHAVIFTYGSSDTKERFSIHDHPEEKLFNVNISKVTEEDGGVYLCGVQEFGDLNLVSFLDEIQLQVNAKAPGLNVGIIVGVCVALLLIGGLALIFYKLKHKRTQGSASSSSHRQNTEDEVHADPCYEEISDTQNTLTTVYATTQKPSRAKRTTEALHDGELYSMAQLPNSETESSLTYTTVHHHA